MLPGIMNFRECLFAPIPETDFCCKINIPDSFFHCCFSHIFSTFSFLLFFFLHSNFLCFFFQLASCYKMANQDLVKRSKNVWKHLILWSDGVPPLGSSPQSRWTARSTTMAATRLLTLSPALLCTWQKEALPQPWCRKIWEWTVCDMFSSLWSEIIFCII